MAHVELFDSHMRFSFPREQDIATLPADAREKFKAVRAAKDKLDKATVRRKQIEQQREDNAAAALANDIELKSVQPKWTAMDNIKDHIRSEREQRRLERGY